MSTPTPSRRGPTVTCADGVEIATWDLGGSGPALLLSHATGFHGRMWEPLAPRLGTRHHVWALDHRGHGSSGHSPDGRYDDWDRFTDDLLAVVDALAGASLLDPGDLRAAGHSLGGAVLLLAAQRRPSLFRSLYCYEPIVLHPPAPNQGPPHNRLADVALRRRETFVSVQAARANYASKPPFSRFAPAALDAYLAGGFTPRADGSVGLCCRPAEESSVYEGASRHGAYLGLGDVDIPVTVGCGESGGDLGLDLLGDLADRLPQGRLEPIRGCSHFGPFEAPEMVADAILTAVSA
jgi:pimeloyl-ACP methyl ester carboxylesterase